MSAARPCLCGPEGCADSSCPGQHKPVAASLETRIETLIDRLDRPEDRETVLMMCEQLRIGAREAMQNPELKEFPQFGLPEPAGALGPYGEISTWTGAAPWKEGASIYTADQLRAAAPQPAVSARGPDLTAKEMCAEAKGRYTNPASAQAFADGALWAALHYSIEQPKEVG